MGVQGITKVQLTFHLHCLHLRKALIKDLPGDSSVNAVSRCYPIADTCSFFSQPPRLTEADLKAKEELIGLQKHSVSVPA